jgi:hypothetical protein
MGSETPTVAMGVSNYYWAVPPSSGIFTRLQTDEAFLGLMGVLFYRGSGMFHFFTELDDEEGEEILSDAVIRYANLFGPEPAARRLIEEFRHLVEETRLRHPGVERRRCTLDKTARLFMDRLPKVLSHARDDASASAFVEKLLFGDQTHGALEAKKSDVRKHSDNPGYVCGYFISLSLVKEGARVLSAIDTETALKDELSDAPWEFESFLRWRSLYVAAAAHDEVLFVGVC